MTHLLIRRILGEHGGTVFEYVVEAKKPLPKSVLAETWIGNKHNIDNGIKYLESRGLVEYTNKKKTKIKPTEKGLKVHKIIDELSAELNKKDGKEVMELALKTRP